MTTLDAPIHDARSMSNMLEDLGLDRLVLSQQDSDRPSWYGRVTHVPENQPWPLWFSADTEQLARKDELPIWAARLACCGLDPTLASCHTILRRDLSS
jgi:hypothetical protein